MPNDFLAPLQYTQQPVDPVAGVLRGIEAGASFAERRAEAKLRGEQMDLQKQVLQQQIQGNAVLAKFREQDMQLKQMEITDKMVTRDADLALKNLAIKKKTLDFNRDLTTMSQLDRETVEAERDLSALQGDFQKGFYPNEKTVQELMWKHPNYFRANPNRAELLANLVDTGRKKRLFNYSQDKLKPEDVETFKQEASFAIEQLQGAQQGIQIEKNDIAQEQAAINAMAKEATVDPAWLRDRQKSLDERITNLQKRIQNLFAAKADYDAFMKLYSSRQAPVETAQTPKQDLSSLLIKKYAYSLSDSATK